MITVRANEHEEYDKPGLVVEEEAIPIEPALGDALLCIAASFQSSAMKTGTLVERLQKCCKRRPKLLFNAWQALQSGDRANFGKMTADDDRPLTAVAVLESSLAALA